jgi:phage/plasmid-like protein (TIGR03299 family)
MAHELTISANGRAEIAYVGETPWHGLGQRLEEGANLDTWAHAAGLDWKVARSRVRFGDGDSQKIYDEAHVLFRSDTKAPLAVVSDHYKVVQPKEVLGFFRDLTEDAGFQLHTAGTLHGGKKFWALARVTSDEAIRDTKDKVGGFLLLSTSADGSVATEARWTTVRVVCQNTLRAASSARAAVKVSHRSVFDATATKGLLGIKPGQLRETFAATLDGFRRLAATPVSPAEQVNLTLQLLGFDVDNLDAKELQEAGEKAAAKAINELALGRQGAIGSDLAGARNTAWGWLNSVTQYVDHSARARSQSNRLDSAWFGRGDALKERALELASARSGLALAEAA